MLPNYAAADTFWGFLRGHYRGDFIVADAKNYTASSWVGTVDLTVFPA